MDLLPAGGLLLGSAGCSVLSCRGGATLQRLDVYVGRVCGWVRAHVCEKIDVHQAKPMQWVGDEFHQQEMQPLAFTSLRLWSWCPLRVADTAQRQNGRTERMATHRG